MNQGNATLPALTDAAIATMFEKRARRADASDLRDPIVATIDATPQVRRWRLEMPKLFPSTVARLIVVALIVVAVAALAVISAGALRRDRAPAQTTEFFAPRFIYDTSLWSDLHPAPGGPHGDVIAWTWGAGASPSSSGERLYGGQDANSGNLGGIIVGLGEHAWAHSSGGRFFLRTAPTEFVADLRDTADVAMGPIAATVLDGWPAVTTRLSGATRSDIHFGPSITGLTNGEGFILLNNPARLTVAEIDGTAVFILVWARTDEDLDIWRQDADRFVASIHFLPEGAPQ